VYFLQAGAFVGLRPMDEGIALARHAIQRALAIDPQDGGTYAVLAWLEFGYDWDFTAAHQNLQQASKLNPGDAFILLSTARLNVILGRLDEAIDLYRQSIALDPVSSGAHHRLGESLYYADRLDEAADSFQMVLSLSPGSIFVHQNIGLVLQAQGDAPAALLAMEQEPNDAWRLRGTAIVQHVLGDAKASDTALQELIECCAAVAAFQVAEVYAFRGEIDNAFDWLERAYDNRDGGITSMLVNPLLADLHGDPRWEPFLDKMGLPH
jgi:adenylate cyclase